LAQIIYVAAALSDLQRLSDFVAETEPLAVSRTIDLISEAISILEHHPLIGRPAEDGLRELVISRGKSGYLALYRHRPELDAVLVLAIRHQREAGYFEN
jgi:plasmid stabilization system protein ParE